nr:putative tetratricopeptide repeat protein 41 [Danio rerio]|eukprot:XP_021330895.1 putative tetratricopeptide repeat protein 41 [Danio rerio]
MHGLNIQGEVDSPSLQPYLCYVPDDLQEDLFYLKYNIFSHLDALCQTRGTCFRPMDLQRSKQDRDDANNHKNDSDLFDQQLKISLDLVDRSSFFICLLGHSYGQCLPDIESCSSSEVVRKLNIAASSGYPWVLEDEYRTCSLTELEITKAAFIDNHRLCFFYFKDYTPQDTEDDDDDDDNDDDGSEEMSIFLDMLSKQSQRERQRLRDLKRRIINHCLPVRFFRNQYELGEMIRKDWEEVISKISKDSKHLISGWQDSFDLHSHKSYSRALCNWFVPSVPATETLNAFDKFLHPVTHNAKYETHAKNPGALFNSDLNDSEKSVLVISGERGCGKSTLAAWCLQTFSEQNPDLPVIRHFCGTSTSSTDVRSLLRLCTAQLRKAHNGDSPDWDESLENTSEFEYLHRAVQAFTAALNLRPCILLIDGIDLLTETLGLSKQEVKSLQWLPAVLPPFCKMIITTTFTDLTHKSFSCRTDVQILKCPPFPDPSVQLSILLKHLFLPSQEPPSVVLQRMVRKCRSPAFLALVGTELRTCGVLRKKEEEMELLKEYAEADSVPELWVKVIHRWVKDYSRSAPSEDVTSSKVTETHTSPSEGLSGWVWDTLCLIHMSRALTEAQVLVLLEDLGYWGHLRVQVLEWARLRSAIWPWIQEKASGLLIIKQKSLSLAMNLLLNGTEGQNTYHQILATFFQKSNSDISWAQKMEEIPWHFIQTSSFKELHEFLINPATVEFLSSNLKRYPHLSTDVIHYWTLLRKKGFDPVVSFQNLITQTYADTPDPSRLSRLSLFCSKVLLYMGEMRTTEEMLLQADQILQKTVELDSDSMRLQLNVQHMMAELYVQMHLPKDIEMFCHKGLETARSLTEAHLDSVEVKLIVGQLLCRLCMALLEEGRLFAVPELFREIRSARYTSAHPCAEGTVMILKAIHKLSFGELKNAERCLESALKSRRRWYGQDHPLVAEVEELLADLWANNQTNTEWTRRRMVEFYRHVISSKETEALTLQLPVLHHSLAVVLMKLGKLLLCSCSTMERREGLDLLQRAADTQIQLQGSEHLVTKGFVKVSKHDVIGQNKWSPGKKSNSGQQQASYYYKPHITPKLNRSYSAETALSCKQGETPKRSWTASRVSVFGLQSDINTLPQKGKAGWLDRRLSVTRSTEQVSPANALCRRKLI